MHTETPGGGDTARGRTPLAGAGLHVHREPRDLPRFLPTAARPSRHRHHLPARKLPWHFSQRSQRNVLPEAGGGCHLANRLNLHHFVICPTGRTHPRDGPAPARNQCHKDPRRAVGLRPLRARDRRPGGAPGGAPGAHRVPDGEPIAKNLAQSARSHIPTAVSSAMSAWAWSARAVS